jgi:anti-sigma regulatory factor (Ser/Thr protein kinase)
MPAETFSAAFGPTPAGVTRARHFVRRQLEVDAELADTAELLVAELAANVVRHARTDFEVKVVRSGANVRVIVEDGSAVEAVVRQMERDAPSGRGLRIVEALADRWGSSPTASGKQVWFELASDARP